MQELTMYTSAMGNPAQQFQGKEYYLYPKERYFSKGVRRLHVVVWESVNGKTPKGFHVHHVDENTWNNNIGNLELKSANKHMSEHAKKRFKDNPDLAKKFQEAGIKAAPDWHKSEAGLEWHREHAKKFNFGTINHGITDCLCCGTTFTKKSAQAKYCQGKCKAKYRRDHQLDHVKKTCVCGKVFNTNKFDNVTYCSKVCSGTANWEKRNK